jgi:hypothetical protein
MNTTRRTFMRQVGVTVAGLLVSGCVPAPSSTTPPIVTKIVSREVTVVSCYIPIEVEEEAPASSESKADAAERWNALHACWLDLADSRLNTADSTGFGKALLGRHRDALAELVAAGTLEPDVAGHIGVAFEEAVTHVQRKQATCYEPMPQDAANPYPPREEVITQAAALVEMAVRSGIAPETVATAQATLARDMAWLDQFRTGGNPAEVTAMEATPAEIEAARVLVALLLETR